MVTGSKLNSQKKLFRQQPSVGGATGRRKLGGGVNGATPLTVVPDHAGYGSVRRLPVARQLPVWLKLLLVAQRGSVVLAFVLVVAALTVYSSTVYMQQLWSKNYRNLKNYQRSERQIIAANESLKNQLAQQALRPGSGLVPQTAANTIFLQPAPQRPAQAREATPPQPESIPDAPVGY